MSSFSLLLIVYLFVFTSMFLLIFSILRMYTDLVDDSGIIAIFEEKKTPRRLPKKHLPSIS